MPEIISFPQRMRFTAIRAYDAAAGLGGVVAVLFGPEDGARAHRHLHAISADQMSGRIADSESGSHSSERLISIDAK
ncbi:hypothetical protein [Stenotrophomonas indicatrix]|uniref:hypothetical protein n=1 Tax=Stenotrophomonas indicatrix TaxID=2045451 RepID=UPI0009AFE978|nr:hypothetical protein [Stenotrophomonas indicatrix]